MSKDALFELAAREKLRFETPRGQLSVESLWDLPLSSAANISLDSIAVALDTAIRSSAPKSFVSNSTSTENKMLTLKFDIVSHIISVRLAENKAKAESNEKAAQRRMLQEAIAAKKNEQLLSGDVDALQARLDALA